MSKNTDILQPNPLKSLPIVVILHLVPVLIVSLLPETQIPEHFEIQTIDLKKMRTVGVKGGSTRGFLGKDINLAAPVKNASSTAQEQSGKQSQKKQNQDSKKISKSDENEVDVDALAKSIVNQSFPDNEKSDIVLTPAGRSKSRTFTYSEKNKSSFRRMLGADLQNVAVHSRRQMELMDKSNLSISFTAPEGVDLDELNQLEQIFYGFNVRIYKTYVNSLISSHLKFFQQNPHKQIVDVQPEILRAKVRFDRDGNVELVKIIRWSQNDNVQEIFQKSLENIKSIPNPPKAFVKNKDHFNLYFNLIIQG